MDRSRSAYRIEDEPRPGALAHLVVNPFWPFLAWMLAGAWCAWPWSVLNGFAVGSPTRFRETAVALAGVVGTFAIALAGLAAFDAWDVEGSTPLRFLLLSVTLWQAGVCYALHVLQSRSFGLHEYYGGVVRNGLPILVVAFLADERVVQPGLRALGPLLGLLT